MSLESAIRESIETNKLSSFISVEQNDNQIILNGKLSEKICLISWVCVLPLPEVGYEVLFKNFGICVQDRNQCKIAIELKKLYGPNCIDDCRLLRKDETGYHMVCLGCGFIGYNPNF